ncbi:MAG: DUF5678 domain-containing protein [Candidatus Andersenbacteria bacterium]
MAIDWTKTYKKYKGLWVAFLKDEKTVVGSGKTAKQALAVAREKGHDNPILMRMPTNLNAYVGYRNEISL